MVSEQRGAMAGAGVDGGSFRTPEPLISWSMGDYESIWQQAAERRCDRTQRAIDAQDICKNTAEEQDEDIKRFRPDVLWSVAGECSHGFRTKERSKCGKMTDNSNVHTMQT